MNTRLRYWFRLTKAFIVHFRGVLFVGIIVGLLAFSLFRYFLPQIATPKELIGLTGRYHIDDLPSEILLEIGQGLTQVNEKGEVTPGIAKSWEFSEQGKVWTFHLDTAKVWHDGSTIKSEDIHYLFDDAEVLRPDEKTIVFKLSAPFSPFPVVASRPVFKKGLIGTGEWRVTKVSLKDQYIERLTLVNSENEKKILVFYPSEDSTKLAFQLGKIDKIADLLESKPFDNWPTVEVTSETNHDRFVAIFFNSDKEMFSKNKPLRQALSYAIDKESFGFERAIGPVSPNSWAFNPQIKDYAYDAKRAKELLGNEKLSFTLTTSPVLLPIAEKVANYWREIGVEVTVQAVSILPEDYDSFMAIYNIPLDPDQYSIWHSTQRETNISKLNNPRIDKLLEDGRLELVSGERKKIYLDFQRFLLEEAPAVFLYHPVSYTVTRK